jgi:hypothetical protein
MKKDAHEDLVAELSTKLAEKILQEEGDLSPIARTIDGDIQTVVREIGLRTSKQVLQKTCEQRAAKKKPKA